MPKYAVVAFMDNEDGSEAAETSEVPSSWLTKDLKQCWWPKTRDISNYISKSTPPVKNSSKWNLFDVKFEGFHESLKAARQKAEYLSSSSGDEAEKPDKRQPKPKAKSLESVAELSSDSDKESSKVPSPPKLTIKKKDTENSDEQNVSVAIEIDNSRSSQDQRQVTSKLTPCNYAKPSVNTERAEVKKTFYNSDTNSVQLVVDKSIAKPKPTIVSDVMFSPLNSKSAVTPRVLYTEPHSLPRDVGKNHSLRSISFPDGDEMLFDMIAGNQYADQLAALSLMIKDMFSELSTALGELNISVKTIASRLTEVERAVNISATPRNNAYEFANIAAAFPFLTGVDVMKFEAEIKTDDDRHRVVTCLSQVGGNCAKDCIRRLLSKVFSLTLANVSSWQGQLGNFKVGELQIISIIKDAVRASYACTDKFFEDEGKEWFRQGTQKYKRAQKKQLQMLLRMLKAKL